MRGLLTILALLFAIASSAQRVTVDTVISGFTCRVTYDRSADGPRPLFLSMPGAGEVGSDTADLAVMGPHYHTRFSAWDGKVPLPNGTHEPIIITALSPTASRQPQNCTTFVRTVFSTYNILRTNVTIFAVSMGNYIMGNVMMYKATAGDFEFYEYFPTAYINIQGQAPNYSRDAMLSHPERWGNWAKHTGGKYIGFEQRNDGRAGIRQAYQSILDSTGSGNSFHIYTDFGSGGHTNFNDFYDPNQKNWTPSNPYVMANKGATPSIWIDSGYNIYQWALLQGDTSYLTPSEPSDAVADAGADFTYWMNQTRPDTIFLDGSASEDATTYTWTKISGPAGTFLVDDAEIGQVTGVQEGVYVFQLSINGGEDTDEVTVTVRNFQNKNLTPCREGGGKALIVPPSSQGTGWKRYNWQYINRDNVVGELVQGGDTLYFAATDSCTAFEIGDFGGSPGCPVILRPLGGPVVMKNNAYTRVAIRDSNMVQHAIFDGTSLRDSGYQYGWVVDFRGVEEVTTQALTAVLVHNFTVKGYAAFNSGITQIKMNTREGPGMFDKFVQKNITLTDNYIDGCHGEGFYIGHTAPNGNQAGNTLGPSPRMDSVIITNNVVHNCGWDGIQLSNARTNAIISNNLVYKTGQLNVASQRAGIILGGNTTGRLDSNVVMNSTGNGIQVFGYGDVQVRRNYVDSIYRGASDQDGVYASYNLSEGSPEVNTPLAVFFTNNVVGRAERNGVRFANNNSLMREGSISNNTFIYREDLTGAITDNGTGSAATGNIADNEYTFGVSIAGDHITGPTITMTKGEQTAQFSTAQAAIEWLMSDDPPPPPTYERRDYIIIKGRLKFVK